MVVPVHFQRRLQKKTTHRVSSRGNYKLDILVENAEDGEKPKKHFPMDETDTYVKYVPRQSGWGSKNRRNLSRAPTRPRHKQKTAATTFRGYQELCRRIWLPCHNHFPGILVSCKVLLGAQMSTMPLSFRVGVLFSAETEATHPFCDFIHSRVPWYFMRVA